MIEHFSAGRAAYFYRRKKQFSNAAVAALFTSLRERATNPSNNLFRIQRAPLEGSRYSAICFSYERPVAFLDHEAGVTDRIFGFLLLVERSELVAIFKSGLDLPADFKSQYLERISIEKVEAAIANSDAVFEKLQLRNMSTSKLALRSKTLEAYNLQNAVASSSASRFVPQGYRVRRNDGSYSATPSTGRITNRSDRSTCEELVRWAGAVMDLLAEDGGRASEFIRRFARPIDLAGVSNQLEATFVAIDIPAIADKLFNSDGNAIRFVRKNEDTFIELTKCEIDTVFAELDLNFVVSHEGKPNQVLHPATRMPAGSLYIGKTRIGLRSFELPVMQDIFVETTVFPVGEDEGRQPLSRYLDRENLFIVLFSDLAVTYIDGSLYRDDGLLDGGAAFLRHLQTAPSLMSAVSEKGTFVADQPAFSADSIFGAVVTHIASDSDVLLCDDLGDEWADFIGINAASHPPVVSFYHAKHGRQSLSASAFHDSVGQAIKNLGNMVLPSEALPAKYDLWERRYHNDGVITGILRVIRGGQRAEIKRLIEETRNAPDLVKRVLIVTSSLSKRRVEQVFAAAAAGEPPPAHFVQLYWLLMSYFSACSEVGAVGYVVCQP